MTAERIERRPGYEDGPPLEFRVRDAETVERSAIALRLEAAANIAGVAMQRVPHQAFFLAGGCHVCGLPPATHPAPEPHGEAATRRPRRTSS